VGGIGEQRGRVRHDPGSHADHDERDVEQDADGERAGQPIGWRVMVAVAMPVVVPAVVMPAVVMPTVVMPAVTLLLVVMLVVIMPVVMTVMAVIVARRGIVVLVLAHRATPRRGHRAPRGLVVAP
jgi:hypothetical protein